MNGRYALVVGLLGLFSAAAQASGPDVIVGELPDVSNYGAASGKYVWAVGTTSCNLGDTPLNWFDNTNQHPVISQNIYRLHNGRYEQIGQAWLKHGFCALQGTVCSSCTPGGNCDALFPGCSDPYSSGLNGTQSGLGPKSEVNAATGAFLYPWVNNGSGSGTTFKRLQASTADCDPATYPGALYFVSSMYVQPQDAANGNDNNNESYRRVTLSGSTMALTGTTQRTSPAIFAWRDHGGGAGIPDANVSLVSIDVPGDGRFWVASKATSLGGGQWHYEFAIQNLNSDRSGQAFSVPLPAGAVVTNVGFRDVDYHSGEPYSLTDWTSSVTGSAVSWATQTFAQNANANALRWDTIYTFRFDCNIPPAGVPGTISLFKSGSPASVSGTVNGPSPDGTQHPLNDECENAIPIGEGANAFSTVGASTDGPPECNEASYTQIDADIWYVFSATCTSSITVSTCGSTYDSKIAVYGGATCPAATAAIACNDDSSVCGVGSLQSQVAFAATAGNTYLIRVGGYQNASGTGTLTLSGCAPSAPANDACANAIWVAASTPVTGTTTMSSNDGTATCGDSAASPDVWYRYRPLSNATITAETCGSPVPNYDTVLSAYTGNCGAFTQVACNDDQTGCNLLSRITFAGTAGTTYYIRVSGYQGATGNFRLLVTGGGGVIPPANNDCSGRAGLGLGATAFSTVGATTDGPTHALCGGTGAINNDIWFNHPAQATGQLTLSLCNAASFDTRLAVYDGDGCANLASRLLACNDNAAGCGSTSQVVINVTQGQNYTVRLGSAALTTGTGTLTLSMSTNTAPSINTQPTSTSACVGSSASFAVVASGNPAPTYQWRKNTVNLNNGGNISGATTPTLTINPVGAGDAATYDVVVTNIAGSATSNGAALTVLTPPSITGHPPATLTVCDGTNASISVTANGSGTLSYQWQRNGSNVSNGGNISGATSATLSFNPLTPANAGSYTCIVSNNCGPTTTSACAVTVDVAPTITQHPPSATVDPGDPVSFSVIATGTAPLSHQWFRNAVALSDGGGISGSATATLDITSAAEAHEGSYTVSVTNGCGSATSDAATLSVNDVPCPGDLNGDHVIDLGDLTIFLANFGMQSGAGPEDGDMDGDGDIDLSDLTDFLSLFGSSC